MTGLPWRTSASADEHAHDQEADLAALGSPGGAVWASVSPEGDGWHWGIYDRWLWEDIDAGGHVLACGNVASEDQAKEAASAWVAAHGD